MKVWHVTLLLVTALALSACGERRADRVAFDGFFFRSTSDSVGRQRDEFTVTVSPVSQSLDGARDAGRHEATRYCIENVGGSDVRWINGPDADAADLTIDGDRLILRGTCTTF